MNPHSSKWEEGGHNFFKEEPERKSPNDQELNLLTLTSEAPNQKLLRRKIAPDEGKQAQHNPIAVLLNMLFRKATNYSQGRKTTQKKITMLLNRQCKSSE